MGNHNHVYACLPYERGAFAFIGRVNDPYATLDWCKGSLIPGLNALIVLYDDRVCISARCLLSLEPCLAMLNILTHAIDMCFVHLRMALCMACLLHLATVCEQFVLPGTCI